MSFSLYFVIGCFCTLCYGAHPSETASCAEFDVKQLTMVDKTFVTVTFVVKYNRTCDVRSPVQRINIKRKLGNGPPYPQLCQLVMTGQGTCTYSPNCTCTSDDDHDHLDIYTFTVKVVDPDNETWVLEGELLNDEKLQKTIFVGNATAVQVTTQTQVTGNPEATVNKGVRGIAVGLGCMAFLCITLVVVVYCYRKRLLVLEGGSKTMEYFKRKSIVELPDATHEKGEEPDLLYGQINKDKQYVRFSAGRSTENTPQQETHDERLVSEDSEDVPYLDAESEYYSEIELRRATLCRQQAQPDGLPPTVALDNGLTPRASLSSIHSLGTTLALQELDFPPRQSAASCGTYVDLYDRLSLGKK